MHENQNDQQHLYQCYHQCYDQIKRLQIDPRKRPGREKQCEHINLFSPEVDKRLKDGPELVSANFVIPYPPGFPIMVPGQVIDAETIGFMRKLDVKEIHGYSAALGLKLLNPAFIKSEKPPSNDVANAPKTPKRKSAAAD